MIVVDVETTGSDSRYHSILSIGALDFDNPKNEFYMECRAFDGAHVAKEALSVNGFTEEQINDSSKKTEGEIVKDFLNWMSGVLDHTVAGQNPHFDTGFIIAASERVRLNFSIPKRIIDLHSVCVSHMLQRGIKPPISHNRSDLNSDKIMEYVGIPPESHPHIAINGARIEAEAFYRLFFGKNFYDSYKKFEVPF